MKKKYTKIAILLLSTILVINVHAILQKDNKESKKTTNQFVKLKNITEEITVINSKNDYKIVTLNNTQFMNHMTDGGGQLVGYFKDGEIKKIKETLGLAYGVKTYEYYFSNSQLISVYEKDENFPYDETKQTFDYSKTEPAFDGHYFFENEKLIDQQVTGTKRFSDEDSTDIEDFFLKNAKENIGFLKK